MLHQIVLFVYILIVVLFCLKIVFDSTTPSKALAYILLVVLVPIGGIVFYLSVGLNYRKRKLFERKLHVDEQAYPELLNEIDANSRQSLQLAHPLLGDYFPLAQFLPHKHLLSTQNRVKLLCNGEEKFPELFREIEKATSHIHIEYYIYDNDVIGAQMVDLLLKKHAEGVKIRFIYDDFGSKNIRKNLVVKLRDAGVEAVPFFKIKLIYLANRLNYRNHRKIIVIDGKVGFVGGINVSDKYINPSPSGLFWRDTHIKIEGAAVKSLQNTFLTDWNFCAKQNIAFSRKYFPRTQFEDTSSEVIPIQLFASGPDSQYANIMYSLMQVVLSAKKDLCITTPYFIPPKSLLDAIKIASLRGVDVKLLVPKVSDSAIVNLTSEAYFEELLEAGIKIYRYEKGFVHAKTMVCDDKISVVGTANLDNRSFELNFEINAVVYNQQMAKELKAQFDADLLHSQKLLPEEWSKRPWYKKLAEKIVALFSALM